jgi:hypothetical protein
MSDVAMTENSIALLNTAIRAAGGGIVSVDVDDITFGQI